MYFWGSLIGLVLLVGIGSSYLWLVLDPPPTGNDRRHTIVFFLIIWGAVVLAIMCMLTLYADEHRADRDLFRGSPNAILKPS